MAAVAFLTVVCWASFGATGFVVSSAGGSIRTCWRFAGRPAATPRVAARLAAGRGAVVFPFP